MLPLLKHRLTRRVLFTLLFELVALNFVILGVLYARLLWWNAPELNGKTVLFSLSATLVIQFGLWSFGLYWKQVIYSGRRVFQSLVGACIVLSIALYCLCFLFSLGGDKTFEPTLKFFLLTASLFVLVVGSERLSVLRLFSGDTDFGTVLVVGAGTTTERVIDEARVHHGESFRVAGVVCESGDRVGDVVAGCPVLGVVSQLPELVRAHEVRTVILALPYDHPDLPLDFLLECRMEGLRVCDVTSFYETVSQKILLEKLEPFSVLFPEGYTMTRLRWAAKGITERVLAGALLVGLGIPLAAIWLALRCSSKGSPIYRQQRVGKSGASFTLYKFRTMVVDAEAATGAMFAQTNDPRVTPLGRWLRRTRLDEMPQLINVLKGDMAFVGPRPERPEFVEELKGRIPFYQHRHFVKPGLTGWAQVSFSYGRDLDDSREKLRYDLYYVKNMSLFFDAMITLATLRAVIRGSGV